MKLNGNKKLIPLSQRKIVFCIYRYLNDRSKAKPSTEILATALERLAREGERATESIDNIGFSFKRLASMAAGNVYARVKKTLQFVERDIENYANVQEYF